MKAYRIVNHGDSRSLADFRNGNQMWAVEVMDEVTMVLGDERRVLFEGQYQSPAVLLLFLRRPSRW